MRTLLLVFVFLFVAWAQQTDEKQSQSSSSQSSSCGKNQRNVKNWKNQNRCIPDPDSCRGTSDFKGDSRCKNPCEDFQRNCPRAAICFSDPCDSCRPFFYDSDLNEICQDSKQCPQYTQPIRNNNGVTKCIANPGSCKGTKDDIRACCSQSPCKNFENVCRQAAQCVIDPCNQCQPHYYDRLWNEVCTCRS